ncbi:MAG: hypothetical protein IJQ22_02335 [Bacteroidales bacterium]|nr:hypothetical protein [Bacteroidales bacterium]
MKAEKHYLPLFLGILAAVCGCNKNPGAESSACCEKVFAVTSPAVKSSMGPDGHSVVWAEDDAISVYDGSGNNRFGIDAGSIDGSFANFSGTVAKGAEHFVALYPYDADASFTQTSIRTVLPLEQEAVEESFDPRCAVSAAMTEDESLQFRNLAALLKVSLGPEQSDVRAIRLRGNVSEKLAGSFSVNLETNIIGSGDADEVVCSGSFSAGKSYYLVVIGNVSFPSGITLTLEHDNGQSSRMQVPSAFELSPGTVYSLDASAASRVGVFDKEILSFALGASQVFPLEGIKSATLKSANPAGWTVSVSGTESVSITAPGSIANSDLFSTLTFAFETTSGGSFEQSVTVRVKGINSLQDFKDFRVANMNGADVDGFLSGGKIVLNTDLEIGPEDMIDSGTCFIYSLAYPLDGQGKTITINNSTKGEMNALFGYLRANVSNLKLAGSLSASDGLCRMAPLAAYCGEYPSVTRTVTISKVESSVNVSYTNKSSSSSQIAGLVAVCTGTNCTVSFENCKVSGKITTSQSILDTGGLVGRGESGTPGVIVAFTDCEFAGEIVYNQTLAHSNPRVGGFVASGERRTRYTRCTNCGKITANLNNTVFDPDGGGGLGGILGRSSKVTSGYNMGWYLNKVTTTCQITVNGQPSTATTAYFGKIIGSKLDEPQQYAEVTEGGSLTINNH